MTLRQAQQYEEKAYRRLGKPADKWMTEYTRIPIMGKGQSVVITKKYFK